jgi:DNA-binding XRE family transcriptional regulator
MRYNCVKEKRKEIGMTQVELSWMTKIAAPNISAIENGRLDAWPKARRSISRALRVPVSKLFLIR